MNSNQLDEHSSLLTESNQGYDNHGYDTESELELPLDLELEDDRYEISLFVKFLIIAALLTYTVLWVYISIKVINNGFYYRVIRNNTIILTKITFD